MTSANRFSKEKYVSLETYKKNGEGVKSPVWLVEEGGTIYVRTDPTSWKAKRIRKNQRIRIAPSDMRGKTKGSWADGEASFMEGEEAERINKLFKKKYGVVGWFLDSVVRRGGPPDAIISIRLA
jgi:uncharacterized protein